MKRQTASLHDIVFTQELAQRPSPQPDSLSNRQALAEIAREMANGDGAILNALCQVGLRLCEAGSCGINLLERDNEGHRFRWFVIEGRAKPYEGWAAPGEHSPCAYVLEQGSVQLFRNMERYFEWMEYADFPFVEALVVPLFRDRRDPIGTIWVLSHDPERLFRQDDVHALDVLGKHASTALMLHESLYRPA